MLLAALAYSVLIAIAILVVLGAIVGAIARYFTLRLWKRFAALQCLGCSAAFGMDSVRAGRDVSPFEELWSDGVDHCIHVRPTCLLVICPACGHNYVIRHQNRGETFGPELSVQEPSASDL